MNSIEIRNTFLRFFKSQGHVVINSSSLIPVNDPTLLFTNSGMVQFKDVFLGIDKRNYTRAVSVQRCLRAGGKHNDLENVGYTTRHHTFFEMLGNWSFGDYFKRDALKWSWELLTKIYGICDQKLLVTVYEFDEEAYDIWINEIGLSKERVIRIGNTKDIPYTSDNFWQMGDIGPCGPCSEIFYDRGKEIFGGPPGSLNSSGDRYVEIWNNVFMQFNRQVDPKTGMFFLTPLPMPCVDTGMGLERLATILQNVHSNYETDLFQPLIKAVAHQIKVYDLKHNSLKVIADHIRATVFLIADGVIPSNEGRGYVLRRIMRRALRHGYKLGQKKPFLYSLVHTIVCEMHIVYSELLGAVEYIKQVCQEEENRFSETLKHGMKIFETALVKNSQQLDGKIAFMLYDTYGFPLDLTQSMCFERNIKLDVTNFNIAMEYQKSISRKISKFKALAMNYTGHATSFVGYSKLIQHAKVVALYVNNQPVDVITAGQEAIIVLDITPFYAESGGQVGDIGQLESPLLMFQVVNTKKIYPEVFGHYGKLIRGILEVNHYLDAKVDLSHRTHIMRNHSATHLLHAALREVLGPHIVQKGSLIQAEKLRFDFNHKFSLTLDEIQNIEIIVNRQILANTATLTTLMNFDDAIKMRDIVALFNEKYSNKVNVVSIGSSLELCCGTHVIRTGDIGLFKIVSESGIATHVRRLEAISGEYALSFLQTLYNQADTMSVMLKTSPEKLISQIQNIQNHVKTLKQEGLILQTQFAYHQSKNLFLKAEEINGVKVLIVTLENVNVVVLREIIEQLKNKLQVAVIVLVTIDEHRMHIVAGVTKNIISKIKANELIHVIAQEIDCHGGGHAEIAQASGIYSIKLHDALQGIKVWINDKLHV